MGGREGEVCDKQMVVLDDKKVGKILTRAIQETWMNTVDVVRG